MSISGGNVCSNASNCCAKRCNPWRTLMQSMRDIVDIGWLFYVRNTFEHEIMLIDAEIFGMRMHFVDAPARADAS
jgi:hypothetical protein